MKSSRLPALPIAYISQTLPSLTTTFIYREVLALREMGFSISTFAIWKPNPNQLSQESKSLVDTTFYVFPISWSKFFVAHLYFLLSRPIRYISTLVFVLTRKGESLSNRKRTFFHFFEAIYLAREMKRQRIRHIHAHFSVNAASVALIIARLLDISFSFTSHSNLFTDQLILKEKIYAAKFIVAISQFTRQYLLNLVNKGDDNVASKTHVIHCGLSPDDFAPRILHPHNTPSLLFVAQLAERKGAPILVQACRVLAEQGVDFRCVIVGDGPQWEYVHHLVCEYNLQDRVELAGAVFQEHLKEYLNQADVFVLPCIVAQNGDMDGVPVVLMEAMSMEIPTVSTYVSGIPELIEHEQSGLLVPEKAPEALADAIQRLLRDERLRVRLGINGRRRVQAEFNIYKSAEQLASLFERYLEADG
jgi:colanic acid/amylovoran biosynthesis glycosyltransferase